MARRAERRKYRKYSYVTPIFWSVALIMLTLYSGWRFGWVPLGQNNIAENNASPNLEEPIIPPEAGPRLVPQKKELFVSQPQAEAIASFGVHDEPEISPIENTITSVSSSISTPPREIQPAPTRKLRPVQQQPNFETPPASFASTPQRNIKRISNEVESNSRQQPVRTAVSEQLGVVQPKTTLSVSPQELKQIDDLLRANKYLKAHRLMSGMYWKKPQLRTAIQKRIEMTAKSIYFEKQPHYIKPYVVQPGDQLRNIAGKYNVPWEYLSTLNQLDPRRMQAGQKLKVLKGPFSTVVDLSEFELTVHAYGYFVKRYKVGIGKEGSTPLGKFIVQNKLKDPVYYGPDGLVIQNDDPQNPLGEYWVDIGDGYGLHGTIDPDSIEKAESKGCIRMLSADIQEVYNFLVIGSEVTIQR